MGHIYFKINELARSDPEEVSYGYSVFDNEQALKVRNKISKRWEVEAMRGATMAVDLYYRMGFF